MSKEFPLKLQNIKEGFTYAKEGGGFVILKKGEFFFAENELLDFQPTDDLTLSDRFEITMTAAPDNLRDLFVNLSEDNRAEKKERNLQKFFAKVVDEIELLKSKQSEVKAPTVKKTKKKAKKSE